MAALRESRDCYASPQQREILLQLVEHPIIEEQFFLTGGTALSVFHLHHRTSLDLDLFTVDDVDLSELNFWTRTIWENQSSTIRQAPRFLALLIRGVKVDLVVDPLSSRGHRETYRFEKGHGIAIDPVESIASNKFCAVVSRTEPKDFVDLYLCCRTHPDLHFDFLLAMARGKDAIFDDPPTAAYQLELGLAFVEDNPAIMPSLRAPLDAQDFARFYEELIRWLYGRATLSPAVTS